MKDKRRRVRELQEALGKKQAVHEEEFRKAMELARRFQPRPRPVERLRSVTWESADAQSLDYGR